MATKKASKTIAGKAKTRVMEISADQFLAGVQRFGKVCDFVERHMAEKNYELADFPSARTYDAPPSVPKAVPGVEQMAHELRALAGDVAKQAEAIRIHLAAGGNAVCAEGNQAASPTMGPIKDALDSTMGAIYSIRRDLDFIAQYTS